MIGNKIKKIRKFRGYTQRELGLLCGYKINSADVMIAKYEAGDRIPSRKTIDKLAFVLNVPVSLFDCNIRENIGISELGDLLLWLDVVSTFAYGKSRAYARPDIFRVLFGTNVNFLFENDKISIIVDNPKFNEYLRMWHEKTQKYKDGKISLYEYSSWRYTIMPLILNGGQEEETT